MANPVLYEINTRCWLRAVSTEHRRPVTLSNVPEEEFKTWKRLGFTHIWLMGVWTTGPRSRAQALADSPQLKSYSQVLPDWTEADVGGSPYAIANYAVSPELGGEAALVQFRTTLHSYGLRLVLDFVPNHLGLGHRWVREKPDLFMRSPNARSGTFQEMTAFGVRHIAFGKDPYFPPWTDTAQLDYRKAETRRTMSQLLADVAQYCDGVRCDMAMLLLTDVFFKTWENFASSAPAPTTEFWAEAIGQVRKDHPEFVFLAEAYWGTERRLRALGFDYTYDKELYDKLISRQASGVQEHLLQIGGHELSFSAHFLENHDEPRIASLLSFEEHRAAALTIITLPGMRFLHEGQLSGSRSRIPVQLLRRPVEPVQPEIQKSYEELLITVQNTAVGHGTAQLLRPHRAWPDNPSSNNFVLVQWQDQQPEFDLAVVNLAPHRSQCLAPLTVPGLSSHDWAMRDVVGSERYVRSGPDLQNRGLYLDLPAHGAQLFHFEPV
jgi:glycosidase